ncbi:MAG: hypothetical protein J2O48_07515 [Solirubrobacterales bacterium]|nr:hypothetical protein [Solirubrobacterales bacterium]
MSTKNITVSVPEDLYREVRIRAAELDTSVSGLVVDLLTSMLHDDPEERQRADQALRELLDERLEAAAAKFPPGFSAADRIPRDELYDERFRRH